MTAPIHPETRIGHVHLKVAHLDRALGFYCGVLGLGLTQRYGERAAFVAAGGYHHHIGLNTWESLGGSPPAPVGPTVRAWPTPSAASPSSPPRSPSRATSSSA